MRCHLGVTECKRQSLRVFGFVACTGLIKYFGGCEEVVPGGGFVVEIYSIVKSLVTFFLGVLGEYMVLLPLNFPALRVFKI